MGRACLNVQVEPHFEEKWYKKGKEPQPAKPYKRGLSLPIRLDHTSFQEANFYRGIKERPLTLSPIFSLKYLTKKTKNWRKA